jgi:5,5'-dehydrodivanillate O-demethylase
VPAKNAHGDYILDNVDAQDMMAWITQGPIADRSQEALGATDRGVTLYRRMLQREIRKVEAGEDPIFTLRGEAGERTIEIPLERGKYHFTDGFEKLLRKNHTKWSPIAEELVALFTGRPAMQQL